MDVLEATFKLRRLLVSHEKAVSKIQELDKSISRLTRGLVSGSETNHVTHAHILIQRRCILMGLREMYVIYRTRKWREFKAYVNLITAIFDEENENGQQLTDPGPVPSDNHEVTDNARLFSIDFCEMNRGF